MKRIFTECVDLVGSSCKNFDGTKWYVSTGAINEDYINETDIEIVDYDSKPSRANLIVSPGDVIFAKMQATKKTLLIDAGLSEHIYSTGFCAVRAKKDILTERCLLHLLTSDTFISQKDKNCSGATQKAITNSGLEKIVVNLPDYEQQNEIAEQLDKVTNIIKMRKDELKFLDDLVKARFVEMFGSPDTNEKEWAINTFGDICRVRQGLQIPISKRLTEYEEDCYEYITVQYLHGGKEREYIKSPKDSVKCKEEDILMTRTGNTGMVITGVKGVFHNNFFLIDFDREKYDKDFLVQYLNLDLIQSEILRRAGSSTIPDLNHGEFYKIKIYEPPIELQKQFADFVKQLDKSKFVKINYLNKTRRVS